MKATSNKEIAKALKENRWLSRVPILLLTICLCLYYQNWNKEVTILKDMADGIGTIKELPEIATKGQVSSEQKNSIIKKKHDFHPEEGSGGFIHIGKTGQIFW